jgi:hypothetical protein
VRRAATKEATSIGTGCKFYERTCPVLPYIYIYIEREREREREMSSHCENPL